MDMAACRGKGISGFYRDGGRTADDKMATLEAKDFCRKHCDVLDQCFDFAVAQRIDYGVWGGTTGEERITMRLGHRPKK